MQNILNIPVEQNDLTDFSSSTMLQNILYASFENLKDPGIASSMWDILKGNILVSLSYTPVLVNLMGLFTECGSFVLLICRIYRERKLQPVHLRQGQFLQ